MLIGIFPTGRYNLSRSRSHSWQNLAHLVFINAMYVHRSTNACMFYCNPLPPQQNLGKPTQLNAVLLWTEMIHRLGQIARCINNFVLHQRFSRSSTLAPALPGLVSSVAIPKNSVNFLSRYETCNDFEAQFPLLFIFNWSGIPDATPYSR